jgi:ribosomal protein S27AE
MENQSIFGIILILTALANAVSSIIAWVSKIGWSKEYKEAKNEIIRAKEAEISTLKEYIATLEKLNPKILKQWYQNSLEMARTYTSQVEGQLEEAQKKMETLEKDKRDNRDLYEKANYAFDALKRGHEELKAAVEHGLLPTWTNVATSAVSVDILARTTSTEPPPIKNELLKLYMKPMFYSDKACPKCQAQMLMNHDGNYHCEECGYQE